MATPATPDELDFALVAALQASPRATWRRIGETLRVSAQTATRRWARLNEAGLAWQTCHAGQMGSGSPATAVVEVDCAPGRLPAVAAAIAEDPHVHSINHVSGSRDLLVIAGFVDHAALARYVGFRLKHLEGVTAVRSHPATFHADGSRWRLDQVLEPHSSLRHRAGQRNAVAAASKTPDAEDLAIIAALNEDCRQSLAALSLHTDLPTKTVERRLARLEANRAIVYRCDIARASFGWRIGAFVWATAPPEQIPQVVGLLSGLREVRTCASLSGPNNLMLAVWLRSLSDLDAIESQLNRRMPGLVVTDRAVTLWTIKLGGQLVDVDGRYLRSVPVAPWRMDGVANAEKTFVEHLQARPWN